MVQSCQVPVRKYAGSFTTKRLFPATAFAQPIDRNGVGCRQSEYVQFRPYHETYGRYGDLTGFRSGFLLLERGLFSCRSSRFENPSSWYRTIFVVFFPRSILSICPSAAGYAESASWCPRSVFSTPKSSLFQGAFFSNALRFPLFFFHFLNVSLFDLQNSRMWSIT